jgi:hypothetical protein
VLREVAQVAHCTAPEPFAELCRGDTPVAVGLLVQRSCPQRLSTDFLDPACGAGAAFKQAARLLGAFLGLATLLASGPGSGRAEWSGVCYCSAQLSL